MIHKDFIIITGMSGAGKSSALKHLEDLDFFCVDNLPPELLPVFARLCQTSEFDQVAVAVDDSSDDFIDEIQNGIKCLSEYEYKSQIIFLDSPNDILVRRFSASYRRHPMTRKGLGLLAAIKLEREKLNELRGKADLIIDTGDMNPYNLKDEITRLFFRSEDGSHPISITVMSFGYKFGLPRDADMIFDARILPNPHYDQKLQPLDGRDERIREYVFQDDESMIFFDKLRDLTEYLIPHYISKGKSHLTIGVGCTGGKHRSVAVAWKLSEYLSSHNYKIMQEHRDIEK